MAPTISRDDARRFYDKFGARQDRQGFYEDAAIDLMIERGGFSDAQAVFELGCGTGRLAVRLLADHLPVSARYVATDLSSTMVGLARDRLSPFGQRCQVHQCGGASDFPCHGGPYDRFVTTYVLDLLSPAEIQDVFIGAHAAMASGGLFCHAGLTAGSGPVSKATSALWELVHRLKPILLGGCRPLVLAGLIPAEGWRVIHRQVVVSAALASEVVIVERR